jgi:hypothetical protein
VWCPDDGFAGTHEHIVIPAKAGIQPGKPGFRIKSGMTDNVKLLLRHFTSRFLPVPALPGLRPPGE